MRRLIRTVSSGSTLFDIQSFNFTYKLLFKRKFVKKEKQTTNVVWNLAPKDLNRLRKEPSYIRGPTHCFYTPPHDGGGVLWFHVGVRVCVCPSVRIFTILHVRPTKTQIHEVWSVSTAHSVCSKGPKASSGEQRRLRVACADVQADLRLRWAHMESCRKYCVPAHLLLPASIGV